MDDSVSPTCLICDVTFGISTRKHHCRQCFRLVCGKCSNNSINNERACDECFRVRDRFDERPSESDGGGEMIKVFIHNACDLDPHRRLTSSDSTRNVYCVLLYQGKEVGRSRIVQSLDPVFNEFFQFTATVGYLRRASTAARFPSAAAACSAVRAS